ncbi:homing endonuclease associated repeat-containing protein [Brachybacterium paraconglomeratum]|uniref:homing endonuclease associated repeat-containing protein n=1 Tax=Brachybacterium paraconglomeratum TaxID=173362 RepID=UPI0022B03233|nr:sigma factor-like helix-turn-helix DNA-binding protein [Brachybacterium paraconglomeratum]MCZ4327396.1 sigma factor-like helix-turn-helix DNA-binding protein [Brachybacterium paraconglomeratum]
MSIAALDVLLAPMSDTPHPPLTEAEAHRALDLAQQGFVPSEIGELLDVYPDSVETAIGNAVPGGTAAIAAALRRRLRAWRREHEDSAWWEAEAEFGIPHAHVLRLVRMPRDQELGIVAPGEPGYLDTVLAGVECKDLRASRSARLYAFGATLQEIGDLFGVTRERIRQILSRETPWSSTDLSAAAKVLARARRAEHESAAEQWSVSNPAAPLDEAPAALGFSVEQMRQLLGRRRSRHEPAFDAPREATRRTEEGIIEDLRAFHAETGRTTSQAFTDWARERDVPGHQTAAIRFGTWNEALKAAGLSNGKGAPRSSFRDEDLWAAVLSAVQAPDGGTTFRAVEEWLARHPAAPSGALVRQRLCGHEGGSWTETVTTALAVLHTPEDFAADWVEAITAPRDWEAPADELDPLDHVRAAIDALGPRITTAQYRIWARASGHPTVATLQRRAGKVWTELLAEAGGTPNASKIKNRSRAEVGEYMTRFLAEQPEGSNVDYGPWALENAAPSRSTVIDRFGSWSAAVDACRPC